LNLPDLPSLDVLRAARARPHRPFVCLVSGSDPGSMQRDVPGADLYAEKAFVPERLEAIYAARQWRERGT
jgi:DNA-binding response OmpR family regulator